MTRGGVGTENQEQRGMKGPAWKAARSAAHRGGPWSTMTTAAQVRLFIQVYLKKKTPFTLKSLPTLKNSMLLKKIFSSTYLWALQSRTKQHKCNTTQMHNCISEMSEISAIKHSPFLPHLLTSLCLQSHAHHRYSFPSAAAPNHHKFGGSPLPLLETEVCSFSWLKSQWWPSSTPQRL